MKINKVINLEQLDAELNGKGLNATLDNLGKIIDVSLSDSNDATEEELENAIAAHIALPKQEPTVAEKLATVGLNLDDLKNALGL